MVVTGLEFLVLVSVQEYGDEVGRGLEACVMYNKIATGERGGEIGGRPEFRRKNYWLRLVTLPRQ